MDKLRAFLKKYLNLCLGIIALTLAMGSAVVLADQNKVAVKAAIVNVRSGPGLSYKVMDKIKSGETLDIIGQKNGWYQVRLAKDSIGWVASWLLNSTEIGLNTSTHYGKVNTTNVPIYQSASTSATVLATASVNETVTILYTRNDWTQIKYNQSVGWVRSNTLNAASSSEVANAQKQQATANSANTSTATIRLTTTQDNTKLRQTPSLSGPIMKVLSNDTPLTYVGTSGQWYKAKASDGTVGYVANWVVKKSQTSIAPITKPAALSKATIVLDPGHGGSDSGAIATTGQYEKKYTLIVAKLVASKLREAGANVILTRDSDTFVSLAKRPQVANKIDADAFISFHFDSTEESNDASGITEYYYNKSKDVALAKALSAQIGGLSLSNKGTRYGDYQVLRDNERPAVLLELGYINTKKDFKAINSSQYQEAVAEAVYKALNNYFS